LRKKHAEYTLTQTAEPKLTVSSSHATQHYIKNQHTEPTLTHAL